ncbi:MAG TPA: glycosyltransferase family 2 protein [Gemmatimonadaceae bacterium]|nr:glycosyltransferase family 2 protein [Gemmatimonadaceae bacterium]
MDRLSGDAATSASVGGGGDDAPRGRVPVTVVVAAKNEARHIRACVESATSWADEVLVVESGSTDDTAAIAAEAGGTVFTHPFRTIGAQRNAAIERARHAWVLVVDADERVTPELAAAVARVVAAAASDGRDAYRVPRRNFFLRREIRHGGWERDRPVRLFRRHLRYDERPVHEHVVTTTPAVALDAPLLHYTYDSLDQYFEKLERYSRWWAEQSFAKGRRASVWSILLRPPARFLTMYVLRLGFLDGAHGLVVAVLAAVSVAAKYARLWGMTVAVSGNGETVSRGEGEEHAPTASRLPPTR